MANDRTSFTYHLPGGMSATYFGSPKSLIEWFVATWAGGYGLWSIWVRTAYGLARAGFIPYPTIVTCVMMERLSHERQSRRGETCMSAGACRDPTPGGGTLACWDKHGCTDICRAPDGQNQTTQNHIALIKAHALNTLAHKPQDVTSHDRLFLISEIEKLRIQILRYEGYIDSCETRIRQARAALGMVGITNGE